MLLTKKQTKKQTKKEIARKQYPACGVSSSCFSVVTAVLLCTQMMKHVDDDPDYSDAVRQQIVEYDIFTFIGARQIVTSVRHLYIQLYNHLRHSWDQLDRPVGDHPPTGMHG